MAKKPTYCWDASVFLAWLGGESSAPLNDITLIVAELDRGDSNLLVSVTAYSEVLEAKHTKEAMERFQKFLERSNVVVADITKAIAEKVGQIRSRGLQATPIRKIKTPDAQFMATAILYGADVFHTLETTQLPLLSGTDIVDGLRIEKPRPLNTAPLGPSLFDPA